MIEQSGAPAVRGVTARLSNTARWLPPNAIVLTDTAYNADWLRRRLPVCPQADDLAFDPPGRHFGPVIGMTYVKDPRYVQND
jgi:hypothetical protein